MRYLSLLALALLVAGCSPDAKESYKEAGDAATTAAKKTGEAISKDAEAAKPKIKEAADNAQKATSQALMTGKIKAALVAAPGLEAGDITIETVGKTVTAGGKIADDNQKKIAMGVIAATAGKDYNVVDKIAVSK